MNENERNVLSWTFECESPLTIFISTLTPHLKPLFCLFCVSNWWRNNRIICSLRHFPDLEPRWWTHHDMKLIVQL